MSDVVAVLVWFAIIMAAVGVQEVNIRRARVMLWVDRFITAIRESREPAGPSPLFLLPEAQRIGRGEQS